MELSYLNNDHYRTTNNIYSLWLTRDAIEEPFLLLECDLFFDSYLLAPMCFPDRIAVATREPWMEGTTVTLDDSQHVAAFHLGQTGENLPRAKKTVNIYSLSLPTWQRVKKTLDSYVSAGKLNEYYEIAFRDLASDGRFDPKAVSFDDGNWYEIDTLHDLRQAEMLFARTRKVPPVRTHVRDRHPASSRRHG